jgi:hypothetical protein
MPTIITAPIQHGHCCQVVGPALHGQCNYASSIERLIFIGPCLVFEELAECHPGKGQISWSWTWSGLTQGSVSCHCTMLRFPSS